MKKIIAVISLFLSILTISSCSRGVIRNLSVHIDSSEIYTQDEIEDAINVVTSYFKSSFDGCSLTDLSYDEERSSKESVEWAEQYEADEAIVLFSTFYVDASGGDGSLNPNSKYENWQWILTRSRGGEWKLRTWGYA